MAADPSWAVHVTRLGPQLGAPARRPASDCFARPGQGLFGPARSRPIAASRVFVDLTPLRVSPDYRRLYTGQAVSFLGRQLTLVAAPVQVFAVTGSSVQVGLLGLVQLPPLLVGS